ncbi:hypothetical protein M0R45_009725 [Rubus argutus]|uniref:Uncharacterized protein n=1 Tax=Rubus argutus TaxID=59490 RepID=A0AAW1Y7E2_RUBAR
MKKYRLKGLPNYQTLGEIFNTTTATGQMHYSSSQVPQNSAEERRLEYRFLNTGVHVNIHDNVDDVDVINTDGECDGGKGKRKATTDAPSSYDRKPKKWEKMENYLDVCSEVMTEKLKRTKEKSAEATSSAKEMYSIEECIEVVEEMGDIEHNDFIKMMDKIVTIEWRKIFLKMSEARRRAWLASL